LVRIGQRWWASDNGGGRYVSTQPVVWDTPHPSGIDTCWMGPSVQAFRCSWTSRVGALSLQ